MLSILTLFFFAFKTSNQLLKSPENTVEKFPFAEATPQGNADVGKVF